MYSSRSSLEPPAPTRNFYKRQTSFSFVFFLATSLSHIESFFLIFISLIPGQLKKRAMNPEWLLHLFEWKKNPGGEDFYEDSMIAINTNCQLQSRLVNIHLPVLDGARAFRFFLQKPKLNHQASQFPKHAIRIRIDSGNSFEGGLYENGWRFATTDCHK